MLFALISVYGFVKRDQKIISLLLFFVGYFLFMSLFRDTGFWYILPLEVLKIILIAIGIDLILKWMKIRNIQIILLCLLLITALFFFKADFQSPSSNRNSFLEFDCEGMYSAYTVFCEELKEEMYGKEYMDFIKKYKT